MATESGVTLPTDGTGKTIRTRSLLETEQADPTPGTGQVVVRQQIIEIADDSGNIVGSVNGGLLTAGTTLSTLFDYTTRVDSNPVYIGQAPPGTAQTATTWAIKNLSYDATNRAVSVLNATGAWSSRASLVYS